MRTDKINIKTENNDIKVDLKENEKFEMIEMFGDIKTLTDKAKINFIKELFNKGTIKGSCIENELYIIDEKYGFYSNGWEYQFCEYVKEEEMVESWYETKKNIVYETKHLKELEFNDVYDLLRDDLKEKANKLIEEGKKGFYNNSYNNIYYEFETKTRFYDIKLYLEYKNHYYSFQIDKNGSIEVILDGFEINADRYDYIEDKIKELIETEIIKYMDKNITKLENGFIYKNKYYEEFDEIKEVIEEELKDKEKVEE